MIAKLKEDNISKMIRNRTKFDVSTKSFIRKKEKKGVSYVGGVPLAYDAEEKMLFLDTEDTHTIVYGSTGSLKTRTIVMPTIKVLAHAEESMVINDSKGELYHRLAGELQEKGFDIVSINLREPAVGNSWNPLNIPYEFYVNGNLDKASEFANDIAANLMVNDRSSDDPFWDYSSCDLLFGLILSLFKYCKDHHVGRDAVNIPNIIKLRRVLFEKGTSAQHLSFWKYLSEDELIAASLSGTIHAPKETMNSILSVFDQHMRAFTIQPALMDMLSNNDFDIADIGKKKTAVFLVTPDEKTTYHKLVSLFVKQSYEYLIFVAGQNSKNMVENRVTFILDEFSSLPAIADMPSMISAARSRNIRFLLVVQSKSSLRKKYKEEAETIISNCSNVVFFTSREIELLRELSELCGKQRNGDANISVYELQHLSKERREALVICGRMEPAIVKMLDIDSFGDKKYAVLEFAHGKRNKRVSLDFELSSELKEKYRPRVAPPKIPDLSNGRRPGDKSAGSMEEFLRKHAGEQMEYRYVDRTEELLRRIDEKAEKLQGSSSKFSGGGKDAD